MHRYAKWHKAWFSDKGQRHRHRTGAHTAIDRTISTGWMIGRWRPLAGGTGLGLAIAQHALRPAMRSVLISEVEPARCERC